MQNEALKTDAPRSTGTQDVRKDQKGQTATDKTSKPMDKKGSCGC